MNRTALYFYTCLGIISAAIAILMLCSGCTVPATQPVSITLPAMNVAIPVKGGGTATVSLPAQTVILPTPAPSATPTPAPPVVAPTVVPAQKTSFLFLHHRHIAFTMPTHPHRCATLG